MTTEKKYPVKECDYCDHVGIAYTTMAGETLCKSCLSDLPTDAAECRKLIVEQRKKLTELEGMLSRSTEQILSAKENADYFWNKATQATKSAETAERERDELKDVNRKLRSSSMTVAATLHRVRSELEYKCSDTQLDRINESIRLQAIALSDSANQLRQQLNGGE